MGWFSRATDQDGDEDSLADESIQNLLGFVDCRYQDEDGAKFREDVISRVINRLWLTGQDSLEKAAAPNCRFWLEQILPKSIKIHDFIVTAGERSPQVSNAIFEESLEDISERMEAVIDLEMWYGGNMNVYIVLGTEEDDPKDNLEIVVTNIQCTCKIRGVFKPPVDFLSCFAACEVSMKDAPLITFQVTRLNDSKLMSVPDVEKILKEAVWECLYDTMIYPRSFSIPILPHMEMERTVLRPPDGLVRVRILKASYLESLFPYSSEDENEYRKKFSGMTCEVKVSVGDVSYSTQIAEQNVETRTYSFHEEFEFQIHKVLEEVINVELICQLQDDENSRLSEMLIIPAAQVGYKEEKEQAYVFKRDAAAKLVIGAEWLVPSRNREFLHQDYHGSKMSGGQASPCVIMVYVDRCRNLPFENGNLPQKAEVVVEIRDEDIRFRETMSSPYQEGHPIFAQSHSFLLDALNVQRLEIAVKNADNSQIIGRCCIPLFVIEDAACMQKCGWFHLYQDGEYLTGEILLYLRLRSLRRANLLYLDNDDAFGEGLMATPGVLGTGIVRHSEGTEKIPRPNQPYDVLEFANPGIHTIPKDLNGSGSGEKTKNDDMSQTIESLEKEDTPQLLPTAELKIQRKFTTEKQALRVELQSVSNTEPLVKKIENKDNQSLLARLTLYSTASDLKETIIFQNKTRETNVYKYDQDMRTSFPLSENFYKLILLVEILTLDGRVLAAVRWNGFGREFLKTNFYKDSVPLYMGAAGDVYPFGSQSVDDDGSAVRSAYLKPSSAEPIQTDSDFGIISNAQSALTVFSGASTKPEKKKSALKSGSRIKSLSDEKSQNMVVRPEITEKMRGSIESSRKDLEKQSEPRITLAFCFSRPEVASAVSVAKSATSTKKKGLFSKKESSKQIAPPIPASLELRIGKIWRVSQIVAESVGESHIKEQVPKYLKLQVSATIEPAGKTISNNVVWDSNGTSDNLAFPPTIPYIYDSFDLHKASKLRIEVIATNLGKHASHEQLLATVEFDLPAAFEKSFHQTPIALFNDKNTTATDIDDKVVSGTWHLDIAHHHHSHKKSHKHSKSKK